MNKKATKSNVWYLLPTKALKDKNLTMTDRNVLSVLIYLSQAFTTDENRKFFRQRSKLIQDIKDSEFELSDKQVTRCLVKLQHFGYIIYKPGFHNNISKSGSASEFELCYDVDNQGECQNNVHPNTNTNTNTKTNNKTKENTYNYSSIEQKENTYNISDFSAGDDLPEFDEPSTSVDTPYFNKYGVDKLSHMLQTDTDYLEILLYYQSNPTDNNYQKIKAYWSDDQGKLADLENFKRNCLIK